MTRTRSIQAVVLVAAAFIAYGAGLSGPFLFDDYPNIVNHPLVAVQTLDAESLLNAARSNESGPGGRPLAALSFALNYHLAGGEFDAFAFKVVNVAVHALNAVLVLLLIGRLLPRLLLPCEEMTRRWLPLAVALGWALHPVQLTSVLYVVQRMTSLSATCVLAALLMYTAGRERLLAGSRGGLTLMFTSIPLGVGTGFLFKENAVLLPLFALVVELSAYRGQAPTPFARRAVKAMHLLLVGVPGALLCAVLWLRPEALIGGYGARPFTLVERLLTQSRVLFDYVGMLLAPRPDAFTLMHDDLVLSRGLLDPPTTLLAVAGWLLLILVAAVAWWRGARLLPFALGWFLAGHALESTLFPLELMHEHRNYVASLGLVSGVMLALAALLQRLKAEPRLVACVWIALALVPLPVTLTRAAAWGDAGALVVRTVALQPNSTRARLMAGQYEFATGALGLAYQQFRIAAELTEDDITSLLGMQHILARLQLALAAGEVPASALAPIDSPPPRDALDELRISPAYVERLERLLDEETTRRIGDGVPAAGDMTSLRRLRRCVEDGEPGCIALAPRLVRWCISIAERADLWRAQRAAAATDAGRVLARTGEPELAREWLHRAWRLWPEDLQTLLLRGMLEARAGHVERLRLTREEFALARGTPGYRDRDLRALDSLLAELEAQRSGAQ